MAFPLFVPSNWTNKNLSAQPRVAFSPAFWHAPLGRHLETINSVFKEKALPLSIPLDKVSISQAPWPGTRNSSPLFPVCRLGVPSFSLRSAGGKVWVCCCLLMWTNTTGFITEVCIHLKKDRLIWIEEMHLFIFLLSYLPICLFSWIKRYSLTNLFINLLIYG